MAKLVKKNNENIKKKLTSRKYSIQNYLGKIIK